MKSIFLIVLVLTIFSCSSDENNLVTETTQEVLKLVRVDFLDSSGNVDQYITYEYNDDQTLNQKSFFFDNNTVVEYEFTYDNNGQLISDGTFNFEYVNGLISSATPVQGITGFSYEFQYNSSNQVTQYTQFLNNTPICSTNTITFESNGNSIFQEGCWNYSASYDDKNNPLLLVYTEEYLKINLAREVLFTALFVGSNNVLVYNTNDLNVMDTYLYTYNNQGYPLTRDYQGTGYDYLFEIRPTIFIYEILTFPN
ncbi:hypothetical protein [Kordia sp.]|uniref:hypothetical protein n=1 Tax=Kordia sp. TaxID=1965332 RepID=UPI003D2A6BC5